ncbi:hypothetical protein IWW41_002666, partial [Coemansia sp. RSA 2522]
ADIGRACDVSADALSERLLKALKHEMHGDRVLRNDEYVSMDVLVFAAFVLTVWCMGWYMVRQWSHAMHHSFADLAPTHILSEQPSAWNGRITGPVHPRHFAHLPPLPPKVTQTYAKRRPLADITPVEPAAPIAPVRPARPLMRHKPVVQAPQNTFILRLDQTKDEATNMPFRFAM